MYMVRMIEISDELANVRVYKFDVQKCTYPVMGCLRGKVRIVNMKFLIVLQALSSKQAQSKHLSAYVQIGLSERSSLQYAFAVQTKNNKLF